MIKRADELLAERGDEQLPCGVTAHKLRHTFTSILFALGKDPAYVIGQLGHTDAAFTLRVYAHAMRRDAGDIECLKALVNGADWAAMGSNRTETASDDRDQKPPGQQKAQQMPGFPNMGAAGFEPATSRV